MTILDGLAEFLRAHAAEPNAWDGHGRADQLDRYRRSLLRAADALAAERDRADRAEARLAIVWDEGYDASSTDWDNGGPGNPNPYRPEATA